MSVAIMGAVFRCGPAEMSARMALLCLADNADDFGFAFPSINTLAEKAACDTRSMQRYIEALEDGGWIKIERKAINGRGNAYFIDIGKIGVSVSPMARVSDLHSMVLRLIRDRLTPVFSASEVAREEPESFAAPENTDDRDEFSDDNPQGSQTTESETQTTGLSGVTRQPCRANHQVTTKPNHHVTTKGFQPDPQVSQPWGDFLVRLKADMASVPAMFSGGRSNELVPGQNDFDSCFRDWWLESSAASGSVWELVTLARDAPLTRQGITKHRHRLERLLRDVFFMSTHFSVHFTVKEPETIHNAA